MADDALDWKSQLGTLRGKVLEMEKRRDVERKLEQERNEQSLSKKLKEDSAEALAQRFTDLHKRFDRDARKFYPLPHLEGLLGETGEYADRLRFYADCIKSFPKVFSPQHKIVIPATLGQLDDLKASLERQIGQWREVQTAMESVVFRARKPADDAALVAAAKSFSERAHKVGLSIPGDYYSREKENFWVVEAGGAVAGFIKFTPADKTVNFAFAPDEKINFNKFVRAVLYKFCVAGPIGQPLPAVRVNIVFVREAKFFTDLSFVRAETKGPAEWIYQREVS